MSHTISELDALAEQIEEPFYLRTNNLPLDALCRNIEIILGELLGDIELSLALAPTPSRHAAPCAAMLRYCPLKYSKGCVEAASCRFNAFTSPITIR